MVHQGRLEVTLVAQGLPPFLSHWFFLTKCHHEPGAAFPDCSPEGNELSSMSLGQKEPVCSSVLLPTSSSFPFGSRLKESARLGSR